MILVRDVFKLKFGKAREAIATFKEVGTTAGIDMKSLRLMTDLVGPYYTLVLEQTHDSLAAYEDSGKKMMGNDKWRAAYQKFTPLVESGYREIFTIVQ